MSDISKNIKVLIIDPRILVRRMLSQILRDEKDVSDIRVMANTQSDQTILDIEHYKPDLIFLGIDTIHSVDFWLMKSILNMYPEIPLALLTPRTTTGAKTAIFGLKLGAVEYITLPDSSHGVVLAKNHFRKRLLPLVRVLPKINMNANHGNQLLISQSSSVATQSKMKAKETKKLVVISGCLGGVQALYDVLASLDNLSLPLVILQHMPKIYTRHLAEDLDLITSLNVREAEQNSILLPGQVYVAPGGYHTIIRRRGRRNIINIHQGQREMKDRPSIDALLQSAADVYQNHVLGIYLSGGGEDGIRGAKALLTAGSEILVQSRRSSRLWSLPEKVQSIHSSIYQYHSDQIGAEILARLKNPAHAANLKKFKESQIE